MDYFDWSEIMAQFREALSAGIDVAIIGEHRDIFPPDEPAPRNEYVGDILTEDASLEEPTILRHTAIKRWVS